MQFAIHQVGSKISKGVPHQLVVVIQSNAVSILTTRIVAPLMMASQVPAIDKIRPNITHSGKHYRLMLDQMGVMTVKSLGPEIRTCGKEDYAIRRGLEFLFFGV